MFRSFPDSIRVAVAAHVRARSTLLITALALACAPVEAPERLSPEAPPDAGTRSAPAILAPADWDAGAESLGRDDDPPTSPTPAPDELPLVGPPQRLDAAADPTPLALVTTTEGALLFTSRADASGLVETFAIRLSPDGSPRGGAVPVMRHGRPVVALSAVRHWRAGRVLLAVTDEGGRALAQTDEAGGLAAPVTPLSPPGGSGDPPALARQPDGFVVASTHPAAPDAIRLERHALALAPAPEAPQAVGQLTCLGAEGLDLAFTGEALWLAARCGGRPWLIDTDAGTVRGLDGDAETVRLLADGYGLIEIVRRGKAGEGARVEARRLGGADESPGPFRLLAKTSATAALHVALRPAGGLGLVLGPAGNRHAARVLRVDVDLFPEGFAFALPDGFVPGAVAWRRDGGLVCGHLRGPDGAGSLACVGVPP